MSSDFAKIFDQGKPLNGPARGSIPGMDGLHEMVLDFLSVLLPGEAHILVIGAGTGQDILRICSQNSLWRVAGFESSEQLREKCQENIAQAGLTNRVRIMSNQFGNPDLAEAFDCALSLLTPGMSEKPGDMAQYFRDILGMLRQGGTLLTADITKGDDYAANNLFDSAWRKHGELEGANMDEFDQDIFWRSRRTVHLDPKDYETMLTWTGFTQPQVFFRAFSLCGWLCCKPLEILP